jgi:hypothetical protein
VPIDDMTSPSAMTETSRPVARTLADHSQLADKITDYQYQPTINTVTSPPLI